MGAFEGWARTDLIAGAALAISTLSLAISVLQPTIGAYRRRMKLQLSCQWRHHPVKSKQDAEGAELRSLFKERYSGTFRIKNDGLEREQINEIEIRGGGYNNNLTAMMFNTGRKLESILGLPKQLAPGQSLEFHLTLSPQEFEALRRQKHTLFIQASKSCELAVDTSQVARV